jgi:dipeptidyl aminopeptidase/acylaminoacyl peptidase
MPAVACFGHYRAMSSAFDFDHFVQIPRLSNLRLSPDGGRLVVSVARPNAEGKKFVAALWEVDPKGGRAPHRLTHSTAGEADPAFLRDGSLLFTSARSNPDVKPDQDKERDEASAGPSGPSWRASGHTSSPGRRIRGACS